MIPNIPKAQHKIIIAAIALLILCCSHDRLVQLMAIVVLVYVVWSISVYRRANSFRMNMIATDEVNETLVLEARLAGRECLFMIDTGYAGPPVLSASYLAVEDAGRTSESVASRYMKIQSKLDSGITSNDCHRAVDRFISDSQCLAYTSGCTMRLMGIGATQEQQADMLMCNMLELATFTKGYARPKRSSSDAQADVFVTNPLPGSIHILTSDFLLHSGPALLSISRRELRLNMSVDEELLMRAKMVMHPVIMSGGSFVVDLEVSGVPLKCTVDTGAPGPICLSKGAAQRLKECTKTSSVLRQSGVNGEQVCSEIVTSDVVFCKRKFKGVPIFVNDTDIEQVDGYVGLGMLRAFDILLTQSGIGFCVNGIPMRDVNLYTSAASTGACGISNLCDTKS